MKGVRVEYSGIGARGELSYSDFRCSNIAVHPSGLNYDVMLTVANVSSRDGDEVGQLYLTTASGEQPELRGLERIHVPVNNRPCISPTAGNANSDRA